MGLILWFCESSLMKNRLFRNPNRKVVVVLLLTLASLSALAQDKHFQVWTDFNARFDLKNRFQINVEPGYRFEASEDLQVAYFRTALRFSPSSILEVDFGVANFNTWDSGDLNSIEFRSFEYLIINWPEIAEFDFKIRVGLEQRWFNFPTNSSKAFLHRARIRIGLRSPYFDFWEGRSKLFITTNFELLGNINDAVPGELVDHSRYMIGLGFLDGRQFRMELHYQIIDLVDLDALQSERDKNLLRVRGFYYFNSR
jgi:hypothetical protein